MVGYQNINTYRSLEHIDFLSLKDDSLGAQVDEVTIDEVEIAREPEVEPGRCD